MIQTCFGHKTLAGIGARVQLHPARDFGTHLQADFAAENRAKPILLLGHMDTVWDVGTLKKMPVRERNGRLFGPGVYEPMTAQLVMYYGFKAVYFSGYSFAMGHLGTTDMDLYSGPEIADAARRTGVPAKLGE